MRKILATAAFAFAVLAASAYAQAAPAGTVEALTVTWGAAGAVLLGAVSLATTLIVTAVWIVNSIRGIDANQRVFAAETAARIAEHERRIGAIEAMQ